MSTFLISTDHLHTCATNDQIGDIYRSILTIKERVRCGCHSIPYKKIIKLITISLVQDIITCLNMLPYQNGISRNLSPVAIILWLPNPYYKKLRISFGEYSQVYIGTNNSTKQRTVGVISLGPENEQGRYNFMSLATGKQLHAFI